MKMHPSLIACAALLALAACRPGAAEYSETTESPKKLTLDDVSASVAVHFAAGSSRLAAADAAKLQAMAASGGIAPSDRVMVSASGAPALATARFNTIASALLRYNIIATARPVGGLPPNQAVIQTGRTLVTTPACPDWSKDPQLGFTNGLASNYGCSTASNFGQMVWNPADIAEGRPVVHSVDAVPATAAINRYQTDKIVLPAASTLSPIAGTSAPAPGGSSSAGSTP